VFFRFFDFSFFKGGLVPSVQPATSSVLLISLTLHIIVANKVLSVCLSVCLSASLSLSLSLSLFLTRMLTMRSRQQRMQWPEEHQVTAGGESQYYLVIRGSVRQNTHVTCKFPSCGLQMEISQGGGRYGPLLHRAGRKPRILNKK